MTQEITMRPTRSRLVLLLFTGLIFTSCEKDAESPVDAALAQSMTAMRSAMDAVPFVGKPDADFALMMIPHHQGAIEMAKVELQFATDPNLRRLAQEIIVTQQSEIDVMKLALKNSPLPSPKQNKKNWCSREEKLRIPVGNGPGMTIFRPDGKYGFVCSSFIPETKVVNVKTHQVIATVEQASPFSPNIAASPDGKEVWFTLKDTGKTQVIRAEPPFDVLATLETGPITNHVNIVRNKNGQFAYITVGGENVVKVYTTGDKPELVATIPTGELPHGIWPSGDGTRVYVALENGTGVNAIDTLTNKVIARIPGGQSSQALGYVPGAVPEGEGLTNLMPIGDSGLAAHLTMGPSDAKPANAPTTVTVNNQGLLDLLQAAVTGLQPKTEYELALTELRTSPYGKLEPLVKFSTNPAGAAIVNTLGPLRGFVAGPADESERRYLVIIPARAGGDVQPVQVQLE
jgi:YVTN family beta-propeller protein